MADRPLFIELLTGSKKEPNGKSAYPGPKFHIPHANANIIFGFAPTVN